MWLPWCFPAGPPARCRRPWRSRTTWIPRRSRLARWYRSVPNRIRYAGLFEEEWIINFLLIVSEFGSLLIPLRNTVKSVVWCCGCLCLINRSVISIHFCKRFFFFEIESSYIIKPAYCLNGDIPGKKNGQKMNVVGYKCRSTVGFQFMLTLI